MEDQGQADGFKGNLLGIFAHWFDHRITPPTRLRQGKNGRSPLTKQFLTFERESLSRNSKRAQAPVIVLVEGGLQSKGHETPNLADAKSILEQIPALDGIWLPQNSTHLFSVRAELESPKPLTQ